MTKDEEQEKGVSCCIDSETLDQRMRLEAMHLATGSSHIAGVNSTDSLITHAEAIRAFLAGATTEPEDEQ